MKKIVIYPGRFQPMLPHHAGVYQHLQAQFPEADVYISTSDKVEGTKSAFNFKEKVAIMTDMHGIPADKIIQAKSPYLVDSYKTQFDQENSMVIFAVGGKDADRFPMNNVDDTTGLDMTVRGEARPKYYQMINTLKAHPVLPMSQRGYVYNAPTISDGDSVASASAFRDAFISAPDDGSRKEIFTKYMGEFNNNIYTLFVNKLMDKKMKTENAYKIDVIKYLSGMLNEAPIDFGDYDDEEEMDDTDTDGLRPGFKQDSMVNQLGKISDSGEAAKDADQLMKKGKEFTVSSSVITDDGETFNLTPAEADALLQMFNMLSAQRAGEEESPREKFTRSIQASKGLESMLGFAKSKGLVKEEGKTLPQVDLGDIRDDYAVEEEKNPDGPQDEEDLESELKTAIQAHQMDIDEYQEKRAEVEADPEFQQADDNEKSDWMWDATDGVDVVDKQDKIEFFKSALEDHQKNGTTHWWQSAFNNMDTAVRDEIAQELRDMDAWQGDLEESNEDLDNLRKRAGLEVVQSDLEEGRVKDVLIDAQQMSREEFDAKYNGEWNYDEILADYPVEEAEESLEDKLKTEIAGLQRTIDGYNGQMAELEADPEFQQADDDDKDDYIYNATDGVEIRDQQDKLEFYKLTLADHLENGTTHWWQSAHALYLDTAVRDEIADELRDMDAWEGDLEESNEDLDNLRKRAGLEGNAYSGAVAKAKMNGAKKGDKVIGPDEEEITIEQDQEESFDPAMEPNHADTEFERIYTAYENGGEPELAEYLGMSESELDQEMTEYAMEHGLHMDDDRDTVIQGYIEQLIDNADHKDMGAQMAQYESQLVQLKKLAGI